MVRLPKVVTRLAFERRVAKLAREGEGAMAVVDGPVVVGDDPKVVAELTQDPAERGSRAKTGRDGLGFVKMGKDVLGFSETDEAGAQVEMQVDGVLNRGRALGKPLEDDKRPLEVRHRLAVRGAGQRTRSRKTEVSERLLLDLAFERMMGETFNVLS